MYFEDLPLRATFELGSKTLTEEEIIRFAQEFDPQPFHVDPVAAAASSFRGLVASGTHTLAVFSRMVSERLMKNVANLGGLGVDNLRLRVPVRPGDTLRGRATVADGTRPSRTKPDRGIVVLRGEFENQRGELVWHADFASLVSRRP